MATDQLTDARHRVVIVGGGFGGLPATRFLGGKPVDVTLVDRRNHHLFQPLLYQTATGMLAPGQIAPALRHIVRREKNVRVQLAEVTGFDLERRMVHATVADRMPVEYPYDSLIVAAGVTQSYFGHDEFAFFAPGMKTLDDALELRRRIFGAFEMAEMVDRPVEKERWLTVVVVGAGPTGVELAGQVRELATRSLRGEFRTFDAVLGPGDPGGRGQRAPGHLRRPALGQGGQDPRAHGRRAAHGRPGGRDRRRGCRCQGAGRQHPDRRPDHHLGRRRPGLPLGRSAGPGLGGHGRPRRSDRGAARPHPARPSRGLRRRRHGQPRQSARGGRSGDARWPPRRQYHPPPHEGRGPAKPFRYRDLGSVGHYRPVPGHRQRERDPSERISGLGGVDVRPPRLSHRIRKPAHHHDEVAPVDGRPRPGRAGVQYGPYRRRPEPSRLDQAAGRAHAVPDGREHGGLHGRPTRQARVRGRPEPPASPGAGR